MAMYYNPIDECLPFTVLRGGGGSERTHFICGYLGCDARPFNPLLAALPPMLCARKPTDGRSWVTDFLPFAMAEGRSNRAGGETILAKLSELMFVEVIRDHIESLHDDSHGWLSGLRDPQIGEALRLLHARPAEAWTLARLARRVGLSRSAFAARFAQYAGVSPMQYLAHWRLQLAGRLLEQPGVSIAQAAAEVGYESEATFHRAFKRFVGIPPGSWRKSRTAYW
jgi:AraC-like DNA-binding protein